MEKVSLAVKNIIKVLWWVFIFLTLTRVFGILLGIVAFTLLVIIWDIVWTLLREYIHEGNKDIKSIFSTMFSTNYTLPFTAYGCYCSPSYGVDGRTNGLDPVDGLDSACKSHDDAMLIANEAFANGGLTKADYVRLKNKGDWTFMKEAITSENSASGIYLIGLELGFLFRIISRSITKA